MKKNLLFFVGGLLATILALVMGEAETGMALAFAAAAVPEGGSGNLPDGGVSASGQDVNGVNGKPEGNPLGLDGIATETTGREIGDAELYSKEVERRVTKIRPMSTPVDQMSRLVGAAKKANSFEVKCYSVGTRPIKTTLTEAITKQTSGASVSLNVKDPSIFTMDDTIMVVGVNGITDFKGVAYSVDGKFVPYLMLHVCGRNPETGQPSVYAVNGHLDAQGQATWLPSIPENTTLIRMGKACGELDVQTGRFNNIPMPDVQYCQNFMMQVEQSTFDKIAAKEIDWNFSDLEEDCIYDMRLTQEATYLFGVKNKIKHVTKNNALTWFTGGIWGMCGKDIEIGHYDAEKTETVVSDDDLVDISKDLFVGSGVGNKRKVMLCGSKVLAALSKIESDKFRLKDSVEHWDLKFKSWETDFGEILTMHHELLDQFGMDDCAIAIDPEYLSKYTHVSFGRNILDLKTAGVRATDAVVFQEVSCLYLRYPNAHARMKLASA